MNSSNKLRTKLGGINVRPIKYRGKAVITIEELERFGIPHENGWVTGNLIQNGDSPTITSDILELNEEYFYTSWWVVVEVDSVGQYTGLKDKNGREICEGDEYHLGDPNITYTVIWRGTGLIGKQNGSSSYVGLSYWQDRIEIIGNIYDNSELLEVQT